MPARRLPPIHPGEILLEDTDRFWLNLQTRFDLERERDNLGSRLQKEVRILQRAG